MNKTTEELKREMFDLLAMVKNHTAQVVTMRIFEESLESLLERLRNEAERAASRLVEAEKYSGILSDAYAHQQGLTHAACVESRQAWDETYELKRRVSELMDANDNGCRVLMKLREERDELRNKLQAFEFANKSAGEFLIEARAKIKSQRQSIGQLKNERDNANFREKVQSTKLAKALKELSELRDIVGSTIAQNRRENVARVKCGGNPSNCARSSCFCCGPATVL